MSSNVGKKFENKFRECMTKVEGMRVIRLPDQMNGFKGSTNPCDFFLYRYPYMYAIECKTINTDRFPICNLAPTQYDSLLEFSKTKGLICGVMIWYVQRDITIFYPIEIFEYCKLIDKKGIRYDETIEIDIPNGLSMRQIDGVKRRVFFDYDFDKFISSIEYDYNTSAFL